MAREMAEQPAVIGALLSRRRELASRLRELAPQPLAGVLLIARGSSDNAAVYGRYVLEAALRRPVSMAAPSLWTRYAIEEDLRGYLALGVSQSGRTPEIADTLERVGAAGAATVAITNEAHSPLAAAAGLTIELQVGPEHAVPATKTVTAQLAAFAILAHALGDPLWSDEAWEEVPRAQAAVLADDAAAATAGALIARSANHVQLGRGFLYAVAVEGALKVAETTRLAASGFSVADFLHGPIAVARPGTSAVAYAAPGPVAQDVRAAAAQAREAGAELIAVGEAGGAADVHVPVPGGVPEALAPLVHILRAQQIALHTTLALGLDPDRPQGLTKVTPTT
ncbi:MAG: SIS domain-containing protein [Solirubrobacteraceae bacterium]